MTDGENPWFLYSRTPGRITAVPANATGWLVLLVGVTLTAGCGMLVMWLNRDLHPLLRLATLSATILAGVLTLVRIALVKGKAAS